jgi:hypothetical protein
MKTIQADGVDLGLESTQFTMKASAKAFAVLSSGLYSNKVRAVIRELSCNAHDSHIEAGAEDKPFEIKLPGYDDRQFFVRDYGTGLTEDEINSVYTTYFESTKSESNDYTGALGLGSKSPFCLVDSFTIDAFKDGTQKTFVAFIGKSGMPELSKLSECETNEPNGLKVSFDVKENLDSYKSEARDLFRWFPVVPTIISDSTVTVEQVEIQSKLSERASVLPRGTFGWSERLFIKQGTVAYPLTSNDIDTHFREFSFLNEMCLQLEVNIGEVDITASRESISFVETTIENLKAHFTEIKELIEKDIAKELEACDDNPWKLHEKAGELQKIFPGDLITQSPAIRDHELADHRYSRNFKIPTMKYIDTKTEKGILTVTQYHLRNSRISAKNTTQLPPMYDELCVNSGMHVIVNDCNRGALPTIRLHIVKNKPNGIILIDFKDRKKFNQRITNSVLKDLHNPIHVFYTSKMERPTANITGGGKKLGAGGGVVEELTINQLSDKCHYTGKWIRHTYNPEDADKMYCVDLLNATIVNNNYHGNIREFISDVKSVLPKTFWEDKIICGVTKHQRNQFNKNGIETKSLFGEIEKYVKGIDIVDHRRKLETIDNAPSFMQSRRFKDLVDNGECKVPEIVEIVDILATKKGHTVTVHQLKRMANRLRLDIPEDFFTAGRGENLLTELNEFASKITDVCPMAKYFNAGWSSEVEGYKALMDYINNQYA